MDDNFWKRVFSSDMHFLTELNFSALCGMYEHLLIVYITTENNSNTLPPMGGNFWKYITMFLKLFIYIFSFIKWYGKMKFCKNCSVSWDVLHSLGSVHDFPFLEYIEFNFWFVSNVGGERFEYWFRFRCS